MRAAQFFGGVFLTLLAACASREVLLQKDPEAPAGVNFSGQWKLRDDAAEQRRRINRAIRETDGADEDRPIVPQTQPREGDRPRRNRGGLVHVFLEYGDRLKITQTADGLFLSFDRAVVEEFRFGENREVRVGPVIANRVSGWEGDDYVVETLDQKGMKLTERLSLERDGSVLRRTIILRGKDMHQQTIFQHFDRLP
jgi:hypothetical protein